MTRKAVKAQVRAALLVLVPAIFVAILAPRGSVVQGIAVAALVLAAGYLLSLWLRVRRAP